MHNITIKHFSVIPLADLVVKDSLCYSDVVFHLIFEYSNSSVGFSVDFLCPELNLRDGFSDVRLAGLFEICMKLLW